MAKRKIKNLGKKIAVWVMLIAMLASLFTTVIYAVLS